jgi:Phytanoyl-CoA dioxygenase (PhyH)
VASVLSRAEVEAFEEDGFVAIRGAVPLEIVAACRAEIEDGLRREGIDSADPTTWTRPVVRLPCPSTPPFAAAGTQPALHEAYDQLLGAGRWRPVAGVGGTIPVRLPHPDDPGDAGWHVDGSFLGPDGTWWLNRRSRERGLLAVFLFDDVGPDDAPTELIIGSHLDVPPVLEADGDDGTGFATVAARLGPATYGRSSTFATGRAGDVFVCHPFLVHRATWPHRGVRLRAIAQPGIATREPFALDGVDPCPVERAILAARADQSA